MSQKNTSLLWKETLLSRPAPRDIVKTMHLAVFGQGVQDQSYEGLAQILVQQQDFLLFEVKGAPTKLSAVELPTQEGVMVWLCLQFHGKTVFPGSFSISADSFFAFKTTHDPPYLLTLNPVKQWVLFLGVTDVASAKLLAEIPELREAFQRQSRKKVLSSVFIGYADRQIIENMCSKRHGPFSLSYQIGLSLVKLFASYTELLLRSINHSQEAPHIQLYYNAIAYIQENYLYEDLTREKLMEALSCSERSLNRAFEGRANGLKASILILKLHKARELLLVDSELSIESIASMLYFTHGQHLSTQYKKYFHISPSEERKKHLEKRRLKKEKKKLKRT